MSELNIDPTRLELLSASFQALEPRGEEFTAAFYGHFLTDYPEARVVFKNVDMTHQHAKLFAALRTIVSGLQNAEPLAGYLHKLGSRHTEVRSITDADFLMFKRCLLDTFAEFLGPDWTKDVHDAWSEAFDRVSAVMHEG